MSLRSLLRDHRAALVAVAIASAVGIFVLARATRAPGAPKVSAPTHLASEPAPASIPPSPLPSPSDGIGQPVHTTAAPASAVAPPDVDHLAALRRGLSSPEEATRIAAVEAAVSATATETLDDLEKFDLAKDPETAPTVIHGIALLGASAEGKKRDQAASTLAGWLRDEKRREGPDAVGNVSNLVEALGDVGGQSAVDALTAALDRADLALHVETLAVQKLGELGDARARGAVERFAKRVSALPPGEGLDEELRVEAIAAARATLTKI